MSFEELSIVGESERFKTHLDQEDNVRIILSGIFGIGKTYFIDKFLGENVDDYIPIKLRPVNYSVSSNEDIFELIKFDIGFQLLSENIEYEKIDISIFLAGQSYLLENYKKAIQVLCKNVAKIDSKLESIASAALDLGAKIEEYKINASTDQEEQLKDFLEYYTMKVGTPKEENLITDLLNGLIESIKESNPNKKLLLIIDDLDRIDPAHIFRIMNVFSAHDDYHGLKGENKFGFDKIIVICDIDNIRGIFHHQYGSSTDFSGYIDKFYSIEIFRYNLTSIIVENLRYFIANLKLHTDNPNLPLNSGSYYFGELSFLLTYFIKYNVLSMRNLVNFLKKEITIPNHAIQSGNRNNRYYIRSTPIFVILELLESLFGGRYEFSKALDVAVENTPKIEFSLYEDWTELRISNVIVLADYSNNYLKISKEDYIYVDNELNLKAIYKIEPVQSSGFKGHLVRLGLAEENLESERDHPQDMMTTLRIKYFNILRKAYRIYNQLPKVQ